MAETNAKESTKKTATKTTVASVASTKPTTTVKPVAVSAKPAANKTSAKPAAKTTVTSAKPVAAAPTVAAKAKPAVDSTKSAVVSDAMRYRMIGEAAYFRAEKNHFKSDPIRDWIDAEQDITALLGPGK